MPPPRRKSKTRQAIKPAKKIIPRAKLDYLRGDEIGDHERPIHNEENVPKSPRPKKLVIIEQTYSPKRDNINKGNSRYMVTNNVLSIVPSKEEQPLAIDIQKIMDKARKNSQVIKICSCSGSNLSIHLPDSKNVHSEHSQLSRDVDIQVTDNRKLSLIEASTRLNCMWAKILETGIGFNILHTGYCTEEQLLKKILADKVVQTSLVEKAETATEMKTSCTRIPKSNINNNIPECEELFFNDKSFMQLSKSEDVDKQVSEICYKAMLELTKLKDNFSTPQKSHTNVEVRKVASSEWIKNLKKDISNFASPHNCNPKADVTKLPSVEDIKNLQKNHPIFSIPQNCKSTVEVTKMQSDEWIENLKKDITKRTFYEKRYAFQNVVNSEPLFDEKAIQLEESCVDMYVSNIHCNLCSIIEKLRSLHE